MATLREIAINAWNQIRDEKIKRANTAIRVGNAGLAIISLIDALQQQGLTQEEAEALIVSYFVTTTTPASTLFQPNRTIREDGDWDYTEGYHIKRFNVQGATKIKITGVAPVGGALAVFMNSIYSSILPVVEFAGNNNYTDFEVEIPAEAVNVYICGTAAHEASCILVNEKYITRTKYNADITALKSKLNDVEQLAYAAL